MNEDKENKQIETNQKDEQLQEKIVVSTPQENNKPQIVEVSNIKEVGSEKTKEEIMKDENNKNENKGHPIFLILLLIFLFAFVYFLPDITKFITDYQNKKSGVNELKSGTMTCTFNNSTDNLNYDYKLTFKYEKNRLKESTMITTNRLADTATDNKIITEKEKSCQLLKTVLDENDIGMSASCSVSAAVQITTQNINYKKLDLNFISKNIAEFEGFYPEYELEQSVTTIENDLENSGYICNRNEK